MNKFKFGQSITFNQVLERKYIEGHKRKSPDDPNKQWICKSHKKTEGIIIGIRTLSDSFVSYYDDHIECSNMNHQKALLVAFHIKRKPVFVPYDGHLFEYKFVNFNPVRKQRGARAASFHLSIDDEPQGHVWMDEKEIRLTIRDFGDSPELQKALECYR